MMLYCTSILVLLIGIVRTTIIQVLEWIQARRASVLETALYLRDLHADRVRRASDIGRDTGPHIGALIAYVDRAIATLSAQLTPLHASATND